MLVLKIRDLVAVILNLIPISAFYFLRDAQLKTGFRGGASSMLIKYFIRYRKVDEKIKQFHLVDDPLIKFNNDGSYISRQLFWRGSRGYEYFESQLWKHLCGNKKDKKIVEMGGNIGYFSVLGGASRLNPAYITVEGNPRTAELLSSNIKLNNLDVNVDVVSAAVVGRKIEETTEMFIPVEENDEPAPAGAFIAGGESINRVATYSVKVKTVEASDLVKNADLIKLDIEGYEFIVLDSILDRLIKMKPLIWVEVRRNTHELRGLLSKLALEHAYSIYAISPDGLKQVCGNSIKTVVLQESHNTRDVILVPDERKSLIDSFQ